MCNWHNDEHFHCVYVCACACVCVCVCVFVCLYYIFVDCCFHTGEQAAGMEVPFTVCPQPPPCIKCASSQPLHHTSASRRRHLFDRVGKCPHPLSVLRSGYSFSHEHLNPQLGILTLRVAAKSWGTSSGGVKIRVYTSGGSGNHYMYNSRYKSSWKATPVTFTVTEV